MLLSRKLPLAAAILTIISIAIASTAGILIGSRSLEHAAFGTLSAVADGRRNQIELYLKNIEDDLITTSERSDVVDAVKAFTDVWIFVGDKPTEELQRRYIHENPHPIGEKQNLHTAKNDGYDATHNAFHGKLLDIQQQNKYYDVFLINMKGDIVYTVFKELDFATNLIDGEWANSELGNIYRNVIEANDPDKVFFKDFKPYGPSNGAYASFMGKAIVQNGKINGVLVYQMPTDVIQEIVSNRTSLGETGETILMEPDGLFILDSNFTAEDDSFKTTITTDLIGSSNHDIISTGYITGYRDIEAAASVTHINFEGVDWALATIMKKDEALAGVSSMRNTILIISVILFVGALLISNWFAKTITRPIDNIVDRMSSLVDGETDFDLSSEMGEDEIGKMAKAVEVFRQSAIEKRKLEASTEEQRALNEKQRAEGEQEKALEAKKIENAVSSLAEGLDKLALGDLTATIHEPFDAELDTLRMNFNQSVSSLRETLLGISSNSSSMDEKAAEMQSAARELAARTEKQAYSLQETSASVQEIASTTKLATDKVNEATHIASKAQNNADKSSEIVSKAVAAMDNIENSSKEISNIISIIDEIAFQTNLLALNAGVEAARAGEAGAGFAVVASEVRQLAQRSTNAAKDIKALINTSSDEVEQGAELVKAAGEALSEISTDVAEINDKMSSVVVAANEQLSGVQEVLSSVTQMDQMTQQNAAMSEEASATTNIMTAESRELLNMVQKFQLGRGENSHSSSQLQVVNG